MKEIDWPGPKSKTFLRIVDQAKSLYGLDFTHEMFVDLNEKIRNSDEGSNYHEVHCLHSKKNGQFFAVWFQDRWIACKRKPPAIQVSDFMSPSWIDEFHDNKLHYREPHIRSYLRVCKANCEERFKWEGFVLKEWIEFSERIRRYPEQPGVVKAENRDELEVWAVNKKGLFWYVCVWNPVLKAIVEIDRPDDLYRRGIIPQID